VSARNRRDAKAARRQARKKPAIGEPGHVFERVALALDQALCKATGGSGYDGDGFISSAFYAQAGAQLVRFIHGQSYSLQAGELRVSTTGAEQSLGPWCWIGREIPGAAPGTITTSDDIQLVDFAMRHYPAVAAERGVTWDREPFPDWFWGTALQASELGVQFVLHPESTLSIPETIPEDKVTEIVVLTMEKLGVGKAPARS
jgi:hypothetical protein